MISRAKAAAFASFALLAALPAGPVAADMAAYNKVKDRFATFLPKPLPGWTATKVSSRVMNSAFQKEIYAKRTYRPKNKAGADTQVQIIIGGAPGWRKAPWRLNLEKDPARAKKQGYEVRKIGGRIFLIRKRRENLNYATHVDGRITVLFAGKWIKPAEIEAYLPKVNYKGLAKVK